MTPTFRAIAAGLAGGILTAVVCAWATTRVLPLQEDLYTAGNLGATAAVALGGGVLGVLVGWLLNGRRSWRMGAVAAIVSVLGALAGTAWWARAASDADETGLFLVGAILMLGLGLVALVAVCGITAAMLAPVSRDSSGPDAQL